MDERLIVEILTVFGSTKIKRMNSHVMASCPFAPWTHTKGTDSHPSFQVQINSSGTSAWNCFTCKKGGKKGRTLLRALRDATGIEDRGLYARVEAAEGDAPADKLRRLQSWDKQKRGPIMNIDASLWHIDGYEAQFDIGVFKDILDEVPQYALDRGITLEQAKKWKIGYHKLYNRLFFAILDENKKMVGWSGRAIFDSQEPKYLHAENMRRDKYLYGEAFIDQTKRWGFLMEGFMDVLNLDRLGVPNCLGTMGTGVSARHIEKICKWFDEICIFPHNDELKMTEDEKQRLRDQGRKPPGIEMAEGYRDAIQAAGKRAVIAPYVVDKKDPGDWLLPDLNWVFGVLKKQRAGG